ncbi:OsmC family protein [Janibacter sp. G1551]|uniref:OsmC family protein n=1 Tax=Janibacter sp. G1551 TaxID=3420440 RepID=UPI003D05A192
MAHDHEYETHVVWDGTTAQGYRAYSRDHVALAPPATQEIALSADPAFRGEAARTNPEQLLIMAASSCLLLSFLAVAARAGVDVRGYTDEAQGLMPADAHPQRLTRITLRPHVIAAGPTTADDLLQLLHEAHGECYIANSLTSESVLEPTVEIVSA